MVTKTKASIQTQLEVPNLNLPSFTEMVVSDKEGTSTSSTSTEAPNLTEMFKSVLSEMKELTQSLLWLNLLTIMTNRAINKRRAKGGGQQGNRYRRERTHGSW